MICRYDEPQARRMRMALVADNVYCMVSEALRKQHPGNTPLNSVEIWMSRSPVSSLGIQDSRMRDSRCF